MEEITTDLRRIKSIFHEDRDGEKLSEIEFAGSKVHDPSSLNNYAFQY